MAGVIALRRARPRAARPYRMWGYPYTTLAFTLAGSAFIAKTIIQRPLPALIGLGIMAAGVPVFYFWSRRR